MGELFVDGETAASDTQAQVRRVSLAGSILRRFRKNHQAMLGLLIIAVLIAAALLADVIAPFDPVFAQDYEAILKDPGGKHLLGTDDLGRDTFSRLVYGARLTMLAAVIPVTIALLVGVPIGLFTGYVGGALDHWVIMRLVDALQAFPSLILALAMAAVLGGGFTNAMIAIGIGFLPAFIRITRAQTLAVKNLEYVQAARSIGATERRITLFHIFPNITATLLVQTTLAMATAIIAEAGLSYIGLGASPEQPSWGSMLRNAQSYLNTQPWLVVWPGLAISAVVLGFNLLGDGLRQALDPKANK
ncbi:MAG: ABC transporter permease [Acidaminococcales bacterium]|jgi:ABC-type dipeptide/oligopeptide/nickel transport system permease subunit|nr:ABC transporter permease [Acidaminococcales bacterium]